MKYNIQVKVLSDNNTSPIRNFASLYNITAPVTGAAIKSVVRESLKFLPDQLFKEELFIGSHPVADGDTIDARETALEYDATIIVDKNISSPNFDKRPQGTGIYKNI